MSYTTTQLITKAWYLSGIVSSGLETVSGDQLSEGLDLLNAVIDIKTSDQRLIPYFNTYDFTLVQGQEQYFVPKLIKVESMTFFIGPVRYGMIPLNRKLYFGAGRVNNIQSLPFNYHLERCFGGSNIFLYFLPAGNYPAEIEGKFSLNEVVLGQDLSLTLDAFYIEYLRYALAEYMTQEYNVSFLPDNNKKLTEYENRIRDLSPYDLTMSKMSSMQKITGINYAQVNIGQGYTP